jgi:hypothetical protein
MPSPFPGMDPYLEHPDIFPDFHDSWNTYFREHLQQQLPTPYYASIGRRAWVEVSQRYIGPDVQVIRPSPSPGQASSSTAVMVAPPRVRPVVVHVPHDERHENFVDIYMGRGEDRRLVTTIELLSLANKTPGEHGRDLYLRKQREMLGSRVHLVEIDLLRAGEHTTAVPLDRALEQAGPFDYHVCIHRFDNLEDYFVYPIRLEQSLPEVVIPLLAGDGDVTIDLEAVFQRCYDSGPYLREIRYAEDTLLPPLGPERAEWARALVQTAGAVEA